MVLGLTIANEAILVSIIPNKTRFIVLCGLFLLLLSLTTMEAEAAEGTDLTIDSFTRSSGYPIILGDVVELEIEVANIGTLESGNFTIGLFLDETRVTDRAYTGLEGNGTVKWTCSWTPYEAGDMNLVVMVDELDEVDETDEDNNLAELSFTVDTYHYTLSIDSPNASANLGETRTFEVEVTNDGAIDDTLSFSLRDLPEGWNASFWPETLDLAVGETKTLEVDLTVSDTALAADYTLHLLAHSRYESMLRETLIASGANDTVEWRWLHSPSTEPQFNDTSWTQGGFDDSTWSVGHTPFGNSDHMGIDYNTYWEDHQVNIRKMVFDGDLAYAVDTYDGLIIFNASDPLDRRVVGQAETDNYPSDLRVVDGLAYIADSSGGLVIFDVSDPTNPVRRGSFTETSLYVYSLDVKDSYAYITAGTKGIYIIDVSDPDGPTLEGEIDTGSANAVKVVGDYAYVADYMSGLVIVDISDPTDPQEVGSLDTDGLAQGLDVSGDYVYLADYTTGLAIINVSEPSNPEMVDNLNISGYVVGVSLDEDYAYVRSYYSGLIILELSSITEPQVVSTSETDGATMAMAIDGDIVYLFDSSEGQVILNITDRGQPKRIPGLNGPGYAYFRQTFTIGNLSRYNAASLALNIASCTGDGEEFYLNGGSILAEWGVSHGTSYWTHRLEVGSLDLVEGQNVLAGVIYEALYYPWFDLELVAKMPRSSLWEFYPEPIDLEMEVLPTHRFKLVHYSTGSDHLNGTTEEYDIWVHNHGNIKETVRASLTVLDQSGDWSVYLVAEELEIDAGEVLKLGILVTAAEELRFWDHLNLSIDLTIESTPGLQHQFLLNLTPAFNDHYPPNTRMRPMKAWTRQSNVTLGWEVVEDQDDIAFYYIYRRTVDPNGTENDWHQWNKYPSEVTEVRLEVEHDWTYYFYCIGQDYTGNLELDKRPIWELKFSVDIVPPASRLEVAELPTGVDTGVLNVHDLTLNWEVLDGAEDIDHYTVEYRRLLNDGSYGPWLNVSGLEHTPLNSGTFTGEDGATYQFRVLAVDNAGWVEAKNGWEAQVTLDRKPPRTTLVPLPAFATEDSVDLSPDLGDSDDLASLVIEYTYYLEGVPPTEYGWEQLGPFYQGNLPSTIPLGQLKNGRQYLFRTIATDTAGNLELREQLVEMFRGNATGDQIFKLKKLPLPSRSTAYAKLRVEADSNNDGVFDEMDAQLLPSLTLPLPSPNHYYVDHTRGELVFGDLNSHGYRPLWNETLKVTYDAYDTGILIDTEAPGQPGDLHGPQVNEELVLVNLTWPVSYSKDVTRYRVEWSRSLSGPWSQWLFVPVPEGPKRPFITATIENLEPGQSFYFRIIAIDRVGLESAANSPELVTLASESLKGSSSGEERLPPMMLIGVILIVLAGTGYLVWQRGRRETILDPASQIEAPPTGKGSQASLIPISEAEARQTTLPVVVAEVDGPVPVAQEDAVPAIVVDEVDDIDKVVEEVKEVENVVVIEADNAVEANDVNTVDDGAEAVDDPNEGEASFELDRKVDRGPDKEPVSVVDAIENCDARNQNVDETGPNDP